MQKAVITLDKSGMMHMVACGDKNQEVKRPLTYLSGLDTDLEQERPPLQMAALAAPKNFVSGPLQCFKQCKARELPEI